ncbi:MAG: hypothetical protein J7518_00965 [Nocardioidaceae bacterium]|nr:hypothetical protein [Nocardioidaceae bacterium]
MTISRTVLLSTLPTLAVAAVGLAGPAQAAGVSGPAFWIDGQLYRTVATPTDLSGTGAPDSSFDAIYSFAGSQRNVAEAKPGDRDFNGGRWQVHELVFPSGYPAALATGDVNGNGQIDSTAELQRAFDNGTAVDTGRILREFVCTVNKVPHGG